nr:F-box/FBD/LRR-repeat protein At1g13570-like [Ipomoea trifida]
MGLKTVPDASEDFIGELPAEVKDRILECLPTRDAARTAVLSRHWNDVWLQHGRLAFDREFWESVQKCQDNEGRTCVNIINNILFLRAGPVKKFTLKLSSCAHPMPQQYDVDRTIKQLIVEGPFIDWPVNACDIFSNVTSLEFLHVEFKRNLTQPTAGDVNDELGYRKPRHKTMDCDCRPESAKEQIGDQIRLGDKAQDGRFVRLDKEPYGFVLGAAAVRKGVFVAGFPVCCGFLPGSAPSRPSSVSATGVSTVIPPTLNPLPPLDQLHHLHQTGTLAEKVPLLNRCPPLSHDRTEAGPLRSALVATSHCLVSHLRRGWSHRPPRSTSEGPDDASEDFIGELPAEVKDRILECLPTRDAARTAVLSRHWNDVWLQHGRLAFDREFWESVQKCQDNEGRTCVNIINNILFLRAGPVKKFTLKLSSCAHPMPQQYDVDR